MAEIFVRIHSPLFFQNFSSTFLQASLPIQLTTFKSLFTSNVQIQGTLPLLNCSLFTLSVQFCSLCHCPTMYLTHWVFRFQLFCHFFNCDLVTLGVQILVTAPKIMCTCSRLVLLQLIYLKYIVDFIVLLFYLARVV